MLRTKTREDQKSRSSLRKKLKKKKMMRQPWKRVPGASSTHNGLSLPGKLDKENKLLLDIVAKISKRA